MGGQEIGSKVSFVLLPAKRAREQAGSYARREGRPEGGEKEEASRRKKCSWLLRDRGKDPSDSGGKERQRKIKCLCGVCPSSQGGDAALEGTGVPHSACSGEGFCAFYGISLVGSPPSFPACGLEHFELPLAPPASWYGLCYTWGNSTVSPRHVFPVCA